MLGVLGSLTGQTSARPAMPESIRPIRPSIPSRVPARPMPEVMADRIFLLLRTAGHPLTVPEMVDQHAHLGWAVPDRQALRKQLFASAYYLAKKKGRLTNSNGKYSIPAQEAQPA